MTIFDTEEKNLREQIAFLETENNALKAHIIELEEENKQLKEKNKELKAKASYFYQELCDAEAEGRIWY